MAVPSKFLLAVGVLVFFSCSEDIEPTPYTYTRVFTGENNKTWKVEYIEETLNDKVIDRFLPGCIADDRYIFYANAERAFHALTGSSRCFSGEPSRIEDTWSFNNGSATLFIILPFLADFSLPYIVKEARSKKMELEIFLDEDNTESYRIHFEAIDEE